MVVGWAHWGPGAYAECEHAHARARKNRMGARVCSRQPVGRPAVPSAARRGAPRKVGGQKCAQGVCTEYIIVRSPRIRGAQKRISIVARTSGTVFDSKLTRVLCCTRCTRALGLALYMCVNGPEHDCVVFGETRTMCVRACACVVCVYIIEATVRIQVSARVQRVLNVKPDAGESPPMARATVLCRRLMDIQ